MIIRKFVLLAVAAASVASVSGCGERKEAVAVEAAGDDEPALAAGAAEAALAMIKQDLNVPLTEVQTLLAAAAEDGDVRAQEITLYTDEGAVPLDWWVWSKGLVRLAVEPGYGPYIGLSEKGTRFLSFDAVAWLAPALVGSPRMQCRSAGSATSAACSAEVTYTTSVGEGVDMPTINLPQANAHLEAVFMPGKGWSINRLSTDGATPSAMVRTALFGTVDERAAAREQYSTALAAAVERQATESRAAAVAAAAPIALTEAEPAVAASTASKLSAAAPPSVPRTIINASYAREPTNDELKSVFPAQALREGVSGRSTMTCVALANGQLGGCVSASETPRGYRFGQAGVAAARFFRMNPRTENGQAVDSRANLTINWTP